MNEDDETRGGMVLVTYVITIFITVGIVVTLMAGAGLLAQGGF